MSETFGEFFSYASLGEIEKQLVEAACHVTRFSYSPHSKFAVGSALLAHNAEGESKIFSGCNVENESITVGVCAERNAGSTAIGEGYSEFKLMAVVAYDKNPGAQFSGASPCGLCRQFIAQWSTGADIMIVIDKDNNVRRAPVSALLPTPAGSKQPFDTLTDEEKLLVANILSHEHEPYAPYSGNHRKAVLLATDKNGSQRTFAGVETELATYSGSITAVGSACSAAVNANHSRVDVLAIQGANKLDGFSLQLLREFGPAVKILFVSDDKSVIRSCLDELLPNSFGPM